MNRALPARIATRAMASGTIGRRRPPGWTWVTLTGAAMVSTALGSCDPGGPLSSGSATASGARSVMGSVTRRSVHRGRRTGPRRRSTDEVGPDGQPRADDPEPDAGAHHERDQVARQRADLERQDPEELHHEPAERVRRRRQDPERDERSE